MSFFLLSSACSDKTDLVADHHDAVRPNTAYITVLGIAQDAGFPQIDCQKDCCRKAWLDGSLRKMPASLGITDPTTRQSWLVEATPYIKDQWQNLSQGAGYAISGILITHAHAGHYTGLMQLGREMMGAAAVPVYVLPRLANFLENNGPWSQLVDLNNIQLVTMTKDSAFYLSKNISCRPIEVPHRDEYSETAGFLISGPDKNVLFLPDIDKWQKWSVDLKDLLQQVDYAFVDGTFFKDGEIKHRDMSEIPHPFIVETISLLQDLPKHERNKIYFIHFNHTNPLISGDPDALKLVQEAGMQVAREGMIISL